MVDILMSMNENYSYIELSFTEFNDQYKAQYQGLGDDKSYDRRRYDPKLFELTLPWLIATEQFMLPENSQVIVHCLHKADEGQDPKLIMAWPLVHIAQLQSGKVNITSLSSFYSAVAEPYFFTTLEKKNVQQLLSEIDKNNCWQGMQLGPFEQGGVEQALVEYFPYQKILSQTDNIYQQGITDYASYYQQRPSQLRNTLKRREKKLAKSHQYRTEIITNIESFSSAFAVYKTIYQQSWKGNEFSFDFIEQVCLAALAENKLRLGLLFVDDEPAAAQLWFLQSYLNSDGVKRTAASIFKLAYSPIYQKYSVGSLLSLALSEYVISRDDVNVIEFGMGSEPYKMDWLDERRSRQSYLIFNPQGFYGKLAIIRNILLPRLVKLFTRKNK